MADEMYKNKKCNWHLRVSKHKVEHNQMIHWSRK